MRNSVAKSSLLIAALISLALPCVASDRDHRADLVTISARFIATYTSTPHKAGDQDGEFIEDMVIPAVNDVVASGGGQLSNAQLNATIDFIVASDSLASEEVSEIALALYKSQKVKLCTSVAKLAPLKRKVVLDRIKNGMAATGKLVPSAICP
jgi:hypothetical protein